MWHGEKAPVVRNSSFRRSLGSIDASLEEEEEGSPGGRGGGMRRCMMLRIF